MKTPWYESSTGALVVLLGTRKFVWMDLYTFNLVGGGQMRYSAGPIPIALPTGDAWLRGPELNAAGNTPTRNQKLGTDVATWQFTVMPRNVDPIGNIPNPDLVGSVPWPEAIKNGALDGATITVDRCFLAAWPAYPAAPVPVGVVTVFFGRVADAQPGGSVNSITVNSPLELLNLAYPTRLFQAPCPYSLFDSNCTLIGASFRRSGTVATSVSESVFTSTVIAPPGSGTYSLGTVSMTSGANSGLSQLVRNWDSGTGTFSLIAPFPYALTPGDAFQAYAGCDKTLATCNLFGNQINYGGEPYIPDLMTAI